MHEQLLFTRILNHLFGAPLAALLSRLHVHPANPAAPLDNILSMELLVVLLLIGFFALVRATLSVEKPAAPQHLAEMLNEFVAGQGEQIIGHGYERHIPFVTTIFLFVVCCNLIGLIPGIETPTSDPVVPLGIALLTFIYYNYYGVKEQGIVGYIKHFMGPIWWITPLLFPVEIISHLARIMSLTIRLYANMFASDLLTLVFFSLVPFGVPIVFLGLHVFVSLIQAYVFMLLAMIYLSQAVSHEVS
jgi:F-type H+-transporting ATPase subunit a